VWSVAVASPAPKGSESSGSPHGSIKLACTVCHANEDYSSIHPTHEFNHQNAKFPLQGEHAKLSCKKCHSDLVFSNAGTRCAECHADIHRRKLGNSCEECHTPRGWLQIKQKTDGHQNRFPLIGAHAAVPCESCHTNAAVGLYRGLSTDCASCHANDFRSAKNPDHQAAAFSTKCESCHQMDSWVGKFDHAGATGFALVGAHARLDCKQCHTGAVFSGTPQTCIGCHLQDFNNTTNPNHVSAAFSQNCLSCHNTDAWTPALFNHNTTAFPLTGAHATVSCVTCHASGRYSGTPTDCYSCHSTDYRNTSSPNHVSGAYQHDCTICHDSNAWSPAAFDHNRTVFPLTGAHATVACASCHTSGNFAGTPTDCYSCHVQDFNNSSNPNHVSQGFPHSCSTCHSNTAWIPATFDHSTTAFPLSGAHTTVSCVSCHVSGRYAGTPTDCYSCHTNNYTGVTDPNHVSGSFQHDCTICHNTAAWNPASFDHSKSTFPLTGAHASVACTSCHTSGRYAGTPTDCYACHAQGFNGTTNPSHVSQGYPHTCLTCHSTTAWTPATFDHSRTAFPLTGAHATVACANCHVSGIYAGTPTACYSCHSSEYNGTTNPNHVASGFPRTCLDCHSTATWSGATFTHSRFPIYSGSHAGRWTTCGDCHTNSSNYSVFTCTTACHPKTSVDSNHRGVSNYVYNSANCYSCHPTGRSD
jgi:hypothetical protein